MKVAVIQHDIVWEDPAANFARLAPRIAGAAADGARLVVMTEMFSTGFSMHTDRIAEPPDGPSTQFLVDQARAHDAWTCGSIPVLLDSRDADADGRAKPANVCTLAAPDGTVHRYAKVHPFTYSGEDRSYARGHELVTVDVEGVRCSLFVCYDLRFADELWQLAHGTECYLVVANWPASRREHWRTLLRARAIENQAYVVGVNRVGTGGGLAYAGDSAVIGPFGEELGELGDAEGTLLVDVDPALVAATREQYPFLPDRR